MRRLKKSKLGLGCAALLICLFILFPLLMILVFSLTNRWVWPNLLPHGFTARGIWEILSGSGGSLSMLAGSMALSMGAAALSTLIGVLTARAVCLYDFAGKRLVQFLSILPVIVPGTAFAMGAQVLFIRLGLADHWTGVLICHIIFAMPYAIRILTDLTASVGNKLETQAELFGCPPIKAFFTITLPLLSPGIFASLCLCYIISASQYFITLLIGGGRVKTLSMVMVPFISGGDRTLASIYALLFLLTTLLAFALFRGALAALTRRMRL